MTVFRRIASEPRPLRFLASRLLWATRLSPLFRIRKPGYTLRFWPSSVSAAYWVDPEMRAEDERIVRSLLGPGDTFVDVGANVGTLALAGAVAVGSTGRVYAFEAHPRTFAFLEGNIALNGFSQVTARHTALGAEPGTLTFEDRRADDMNAVSTGGGISVPVARLDDLDTGSGPIALLKIDVEGYEPFVLKGAERTLARTRAVMMECSEELLRRFGHGREELLALIRGAGFEVVEAGGGNMIAKR